MLGTMRIACALLLLAACGGSSRPPAAEEPGELGCLRSGLKTQYRVVPPSTRENHPAFGQAWADADAGEAAFEADPATAAQHFTACGGRYAEVPADHFQREQATTNAEICFDNALQAYADAGTLEPEGRAALEAAAEADPLLADHLRAGLASPPAGCAP
jgi:hypothetical protein